MTKRAHIVAMGRVQGVSFRAYAQREARRLDLLGYVRNLPNGDVEIIAEGEDSALESLVAWIRKGPPLAHVAEVRVQYTEGSGGFHNFEIRYH